VTLILAPTTLILAPTTLILISHNYPFDTP
jgi:hypothetical protein